MECITTYMTTYIYIYICIYIYIYIWIKKLSLLFRSFINVKTNFKQKYR